MKWKGVSYMGKIARIARSCWPSVQAPVPFQACWATPMVTKPTCAAPLSISSMFSLGPFVGSIATRMPRARARIPARPSP